MELPGPPSTSVPRPPPRHVRSDEPEFMEATDARPGSLGRSHPTHSPSFTAGPVQSWPRKLPPAPVTTSLLNNGPVNLPKVFN